MGLEFMECESCSCKLGSPILCPSCLNNRALIAELKECIDEDIDLVEENCLDK